MRSTALWHTWMQTVAADPTATAVIEARDDTIWSRHDLTAEVLSMAGGTPRMPGAGQVVGFAQGNGRRWLTTFLALQKLGVVALPLDASLPANQWPDTALALGAHWLWTPAGDWHPLSPERPPLEGDFCLVKTTSGTTGQPRPLVFTSDNMLADGRQIAATMAIGPHDRNLGAIPFGHSYGLGNLVLPLIAQGTPIIASDEIGRAHV